LVLIAADADDVTEFLGFSDMATHLMFISRLRMFWVKLLLKSGEGIEFANSIAEFLDTENTVRVIQETLEYGIPKTHGFISLRF
jgi:hypothetical protein